jgi:hypothetical protein
MASDRENTYQTKRGMAGQKQDIHGQRATAILYLP